MQMVDGYLNKEGCWDPQKSNNKIAIKVVFLKYQFQGFFVKGYICICMYGYMYPSNFLSLPSVSCNF